ncbi:MAG TPA: ABC transporter ATP-binding protein [Firmicutes bacterium]|nr:ABC transporter ATP-binding protein [Bacillota bacterium]
MALLELKSIKKDYIQGQSRVPALRGLDLHIEAGEFISIAGPSGSGKTTLLNLIGCLDTPTEGTIILDGRDLSHCSKDELAGIRREKIGFVFQSYNLIPVLTAYENVEFTLALLRSSRELTPEQSRDKVMQILADVGLKGLEKRRPGDLSGGQQQRVAIARALVKEPLLLLADEPTANLDSDTGQEILDLMLQMNREKGTTFIFSTHDAMVMDYARRLILVRDGQIVEDQRRSEQ